MSILPFTVACTPLHSHLAQFLGQHKASWNLFKLLGEQGKARNGRRSKNTAHKKSHNLISGSNTMQEKYSPLFSFCSASENRSAPHTFFCCLTRVWYHSCHLPKCNCNGFKSKVFKQFKGLVLQPTVLQAYTNCVQIFFLLASGFTVGCKWHGSCFVSSWSTLCF